MYKAFGLVDSKKYYEIDLLLYVCVSEHILLSTRVHVTLFSLRLSFLNDVTIVKCFLFKCSPSSSVKESVLRQTISGYFIIVSSFILLFTTQFNQMNITALTFRIIDYVYHYILFKYSNKYSLFNTYYHSINYTLMDHIYSDLCITFIVCAGTPLRRHK